MRPLRIAVRTRVDAPARDVFSWYSRPGAFERCTPPWEDVVVLERGSIADGRTVVLVRIGPARRRWVAQHFDYLEGRRFRDRQVEGPFASWVHTHLVEPDNAGGALVTDEIECRLPFGPLGLLAAPAVRARVERGLRHRHAILAADLARHREIGAAPARVAVTGAGGLVGSALVPFLATGGHEVVPIVRAARPGAPGAIVWDPRRGPIDDPKKLEGLDAVVHLAGESIAAKRWSAAQKEEIRRSRVEGTRGLAEQLARLARPPKALVCASAIGFYGDRDDEVLDEETAPGRDFLAATCQEWERACAAAEARGIRVVNLRFGIVLSPRGGALAKMLLPFRMGAGGKVGSGDQWMSWVGLDDVVGAVHRALFLESLRGPANVVAPVPVRNAEFARTLGRVLRRPAIAPLPAPAVELLFGEMGRALLLSSQRVEPARLRASGYRFLHPTLEEALRFELGR